MTSIHINFILLIILFNNFSNAQPADVNYGIDNRLYFPINNGITLIYESSFDECITQYIQDGLFTISSSEADDFKYRQILIIKEEGIYVKETYQYLKVFLFIKKEETTTYQKPLLRFPLPLSVGMEWKWEGDQYSDEDTNKVKVTGKALGMEIINTEAGMFETIKLESIVESSADSKNIVTEWYADGIGLIKANIIIQGGGLMGILSDILGYGTIEFELKEIRKQ